MREITKNSSGHAADDAPLEPELGVLVEAMAEDVHNEWMAGRIEAGWQYGAKRDDDLKQHPCILPYEELSQEEREYDRRTALATLRFIQRMGFRVIKNSQLEDI